jgi:hypothetical protein
MSLSFLDKSYTDLSDDNAFDEENVSTVALYKEPGFLLPPAFNVTQLL